VPGSLEINFHNPIAVRTALITAMLGFVLGSLPIPIPGLWLIISLLTAGFLAVFLYKRRTGESLSVVAGARIGWITGLFSFTIATIFFTLTMLLISGEGGFLTMFRDQMRERGAREADLEQMLQLLQTPVGLGGFLFLALVLLFIMFTIFPTLGGVLGAKVFARDRA
jgi:hypothetical protein